MVAMPRYGFKRLSLSFGGALVILLVIAVLLAWRRLDTSKMACDPEVPIDHARLAELNPLRDRGPEVAATLVMKVIESGGCQQFSSGQSFCSERKPVESWRVTGIFKGKSKATVRIWVTGRVHDGSFGDDALYVQVRKVGTNWNLVSVEWSDPC